MNRSVSFTPLTCNKIFLIVKHSCFREKLSDVLFFFRQKFNKSLCKNIFLLSLHLCPSLLVRAPPQLTLSPSNTTLCAPQTISNVWDLTTVSHPKSLQEILKQQIKVYIYIDHHVRGQWYRPISTQTAKTPFLDSCSFHITCPTNIRPYCLMKNHPPITLQRHLSPFLPNQ